MKRGCFLSLIVLCLATASLRAIPPELMRRGLSRACRMAYYPSRKELYVSFDFSRKNVRLRPIVEVGQAIKEVNVALYARGGQEPLAAATVPVTDGASEDFRIRTPDLEGEYLVRCTMNAAGKEHLVELPLVRRHFAWEGNQLGVSDAVFPPFAPVRVDERRVVIVGRVYTLNALGVLDSVISLDRELLAAPMTIVRVDAEGQTASDWQGGSVKFDKLVDQTATFTTHAASGPVNIACTVAVDFDGCARIEMTLAPGATPQPIHDLYIDIPLIDKEMPLFHQYVDGPRINIAGNTPEGDGVIWDSTKARRYGSWLNSFCPYLWAGAERRGLAWFAENDQGWFTAKDDGKAPIQEVVRQDGKLIFRIHLVNTPTTITAPSTLVFGMQASPTKPMPENWRAELHTKPGMSGPVNPWGGLHCSYMGPYRDNWKIVDEIVKGRETGETDLTWLEQYAEEHDPPPVYGTRPWLESVSLFARRATEKGPDAALLTYHEEMAASQIKPEWETWQDEWGLQEYTQREWPDESILRRGFNVNPSSKVSFPTSYWDYGCHYANEWLKRGVGLYWDNTYPTACFDTRTSAAYRAADGKLQPAVIFWNQRNYQKRIWNLLHARRATSKYPLEWSLHTTNACLLPLQTLATTQLDLEWGWNVPFPPDLIRTESTGLQVGNYPTLCHDLTGRGPQFDDWHGFERETVEWGMRLVHEISRGGPGNYRIRPSQLERSVFGFGYGQPENVIHNYWAEQPALSLDHDEVEWIAIARPEQEDLLLVLQSWMDGPARTRVSLDRKVLGFEPPAAAWDLRSGEEFVVRDDKLDVDLPNHYQTRILRFANAPLPDLAPLFAEDFEDGVSLRWDYFSVHILDVPEDPEQPKRNHVARLGLNQSRWQGPQRMEIWPHGDQGPANWQDYEFSFRLRLGKKPTEGDRLLVWKWRGQEPAFSKHGLSHTQISDGYIAHLRLREGMLTVDLEGFEKSWTRTDWKAAPDSQWHDVTVRCDGPEMTILWDGQQVWKGRHDAWRAGGVGIAGDSDTLPCDYIEIDNVRVRALEP